ncbi:DUF397 domain-containing protein [Streptomyces sp. NPDC003077]|uniref:DUF397 domain-containing protein n=1 Tax=Streptomyces sp. NPDC003077 TaxID=3154443 RepID=UPI0033A2DE7A
MRRLTQESLRWQKSYFSGAAGENCVEMANWERSSLSDAGEEGGVGVGPAVVLRESDEPGVILVVSVASTRELVKSLKSGMNQ